MTTIRIEGAMKMLKTILLGAALVLPAWGASAAEMPVGHFVRVYDRAHLTAHPGQLVKEVDLKLKRSSTHNGVRDFSLRMKLRGRDKALTTAGFCLSEGSSLKCIVECDGGGVRIEPRGDHVIMMHLDRIRMVTCGGDLLEDGEEIVGGKDDRVFRLSRN